MSVDNQGRRSRVTLTEVARVAGVSPALVSIVMRDAPGASDQTRQRVRQVAADLGYRPDQRARLLRQHRSRLLGVAFGVEHAFHGDLVEAIYAAAESRGYGVALSAVAPSRSEQRAIEALLDDRCEALLLLGPTLSVSRLSALAQRLPVVSLARRVADPAIDSVRSDDRAGITQAVDHLVELGHRDIVHIDGGRAPGAADRRNGYRAAMTRHGLAARTQVLPGGLSEEDGAAATRQLLAGALHPTAIIAFNDRCATGVLDTLIRARLDIPGDLSVIGYDDSRLARLSHLNLTSVGQNAQALADLAVTRAIDRLAGHTVEQRNVVTRPHLVIRSSTGPAGPTS